MLSIIFFFFLFVSCFCFGKFSSVPGCVCAQRYLALNTQQTCWGGGGGGEVVQFYHQYFHYRYYSFSAIMRSQNRDYVIITITTDHHYLPLPLNWWSRNSDSITIINKFIATNGVLLVETCAPDLYLFACYAYCAIHSNILRVIFR